MTFDTPFPDQDNSNSDPKSNSESERSEPENIKPKRGRPPKKVEIVDEHSTINSAPKKQRNRSKNLENITVPAPPDDFSQKQETQETQGKQETQRDQAQDKQLIYLLQKFMNIYDDPLNRREHRLNSIENCLCPIHHVPLTSLSSSRINLFPAEHMKNMPEFSKWVSPALYIMINPNTGNYRGQEDKPNVQTESESVGVSTSNKIPDALSIPQTMTESESVAKTIYKDMSLFIDRTADISGYKLLLTCSVPDCYYHQTVCLQADKKSDASPDNKSFLYKLFFENTVNPEEVSDKFNTEIKDSVKEWIYDEIYPLTKEAYQYLSAHVHEKWENIEKYSHPLNILGAYFEIRAYLLSLYLQRYNVDDRNKLSAQAKSQEKPEKIEKSIEHTSSVNTDELKQTQSEQPLSSTAEIETDKTVSPTMYPELDINQLAQIKLLAQRIYTDKHTVALRHNTFVEVSDNYYHYLNPLFHASVQRIFYLILHHPSTVTLLQNLWHINIVSNISFFDYLKQSPYSQWFNYQLQPDYARVALEYTLRNDKLIPEFMRINNKSEPAPDDFISPIDFDPAEHQKGLQFINDYRYGRHYNNLNKVPEEEVKKALPSLTLYDISLRLNIIEVLESVLTDPNVDKNSLPLDERQIKHLYDYHRFMKIDNPSQVFTKNELLPNTPQSQDYNHYYLIQEAYESDYHKPYLDAIRYSVPTIAKIYSPFIDLNSDKELRKKRRNKPEIPHLISLLQNPTFKLLFAPKHLQYLFYRFQHNVDALYHYLYITLMEYVMAYYAGYTAIQSLSKYYKSFEIDNTWDQFVEHFFNQ